MLIDNSASALAFLEASGPAINQSAVLIFVVTLLSQIPMYPHSQSCFPATQQSFCLRHQCFLHHIRHLSFMSPGVN